MTSMDNTPDSPAKTPEGYTTQGGNFWTLITPEIWKVLHAVLQLEEQNASLKAEVASLRERLRRFEHLDDHLSRTGRLLPA